MFAVNDVVMYGAFGVCRIDAIEKRKLMEKEREYYILRHLFSKNSICYVPVDSETAVKKLHTVSSKAEVEELLQQMKDNESVWIRNDDLRKEEYRRIIKSGNKRELLRLIRTLYLQRKAFAAEKKTLHSTDEKFLTEAESMLYEEFAYALNTDRDEVEKLVKKQIYYGGISP